MSLKITHLSVSLEEKEILHKVSLDITPGTVHVLMGPNGSGKSTFAAALMGDPRYIIDMPGSEITLDGTAITEMEADERAKQGLFLAFQNPVAVPGVTVANLLRTAVPKQEGSKKNPATVWEFNKRLVEESKKLAVSQDFLRRSLNEAFSGGEKKKLEMLQAIMLAPRYAIFDEIDTGLDVDALKIVASGIQRLKENKCGILIITHYQRILQYIHPDVVHILVNGKLIVTGDKALIEEVERDGYKKWTKETDVVKR